LCRFGIQTFTLQSAHAVHQQQFISWLSVFGLSGEAGPFSPVLSVVASLMGVITFCMTWSFFFTTAGVVKRSLSTDPMAWNMAGAVLFKDIVLFCVCVVLFLAALPRSVPERERGT
jgi:uncharacterized membrane protein YkgB